MGYMKKKNLEWKNFDNIAAEQDQFKKETFTSTTMTIIEFSWGRSWNDSIVAF